MKNQSFFKGWRLLCWLLPCMAYGTTFTTRHPDYLLAQQQTQITGTVTVAGMPINGVSISVQSKSATALSGDDGTFTINAAPTDTLLFSFVGFKTRIEPLNGRTSLTVSLEEETTTIQEVTVNAGYYTVKEKERTGSITKIKAVDIERQPVSNPLAAMQGRMAGVNIIQSAGTPGSGFSIQIRGLNSLRGEGNDPLYVLDGVPYASQSLGNSDVTGTIFGNMNSPLSSLNPADIESIEVLKDADATAIYGSRGANGVVLITTKKGKVGKTKLDIHTYTTLGKVTRKLKLLTTRDYIAMREEAFANDGVDTYPNNAYDVNGTWDQSRYTDWQKELIGGTAHIYNTQFSVGGGSKLTQFLLSGTYRKETTVFPGDAHFNRGAVHANFSHASDDNRFNLAFSAIYSGDKNTLPAVDLTRQSYLLAPNAPSLYDDSGNLNWENGTFENPLANLKGSYKNTTNTLIANTTLSYNFFEGIEAKISAGYTDSKLSERRGTPHTVYNPIYNLTTANSDMMRNDGMRRSWILEPQLSWRKQWSDLKVNLLTGTTFQLEKQTNLALDAYGFPSNSLMNSLSAATTLTIFEDDYSEYRYHALFGRANFSLKDRYILNLTGRRDGSSRFGPQNRFANFGAMGAAWLFSKEAFLQDKSTILSFGKIRASYGITGNDQIGDYQYLDTYRVTPNVYDGITGVQPTRLFNPTFGWETNKKIEAAVELGFLKDRIFLTTAWFRNRSSNQLVGVPLPGTTGFGSIQANLDATVQNTGWEFEWRSENIKSANFNWTSIINLSIPKNKLLAFPGLATSTYKNRFIIGESIYIQRLYHYTGIDPETGVYTFEDVNDDGVISAANDLNSHIDLTPSYYGGVSNQFSYKNWTLDFLLHFVKQKALDVRTQFPMTGTLSNQPQTAIGHGAQLYSAGNSSQVFQAYNSYTMSDAMIQDGSFMRLKSLLLSYQIPDTVSKSIKSRVYVQGQNLFTITNYNGADPENKSGFYLPPLMQITIGAQISF